MTATRLPFSRRLPVAEMTRILVQAERFNVADEYRQLRERSLEIGALVTFVGTVRDINQDDQVTALHLEHYPGMTEKELAGIVGEATGRWDIIASTVIHRVGDLLPGDEIVFVGIASRHRHDAFDACQFIMDFLKTRATFWKKEKTPDGDRWLDMRESDITAASHWHQPKNASE